MSDQDFNLMGWYTFDDILTALEHGWKFADIITLRDGTRNLWDVVNYYDGYIHVRHYGSTAYKPTAENVEHIITKVFKLTIPEFIREFIAYL